MLAQLMLSLRSLWRLRRAQSALIILLLGSGIALATAALATHRGLHWQPLPYHDDVNLYWLWSVRPDVDRAYFSIPDFHDLRARSTRSVAIAGHTPFDANLRREGVARRVSGLRVSGNFFATLGSPPRHGRLLDEQDALAAAPHAVLDWPMFQRELDGDPARLGSVLDLDGAAYSVVGVMPPGFMFPGAETDPGFAVPLAIDSDPRKENRAANFIRPIVRARPGADRALLYEEFRRTSAELAAEYPQTNAMKLAPAVVPLRAEMAGRSGRLSGAVLVMIGILIAVIALNLASLVLLTTRRRAGEFAVRDALGAGRWAGLRPLLAEQVLIGAAGVLLGLVALAPVLQATQRMVADPELRLALATPQPVDYLIAVLLGLALMLAIAAPAVWVAARRSGPVAALRGAAVGQRDVGYGRTILTAEVALTTALCVALATVLSTWRGLDRLDPGFTAGEIATLRMSLPTRSYATPEALNVYLDRVLQMMAEDGLEPAFASALPLSQINSRVDFDLPGFVARQAGEVPTAQVRWVSPHYFESMGMELRRGRGFTAGDHAAAEPVAIVDTALQARYGATGELLGGVLTVSGQAPTRVVGTVATVPHFELGEKSNGTIYLPVAQLTPRYSGFVTSRFSLLGRGPGDADATLERMRSALARVDPQLAASLPMPMQAYLQTARRPVNIALRLIGGLALCCAVLCLLGAFALSAASSQLRRREVAIRLALGAGVGRLQRQLLQVPLQSLGAGLLIGAVLAVFAQSAIREALGAAARLQAGIAAGLLCALAVAIVLAALWPTRRQVAMTPSEGLRAE